MPICPRCGKSLCNQQSLDNHTKSNRCNTSIQMRNNLDYDYSFYCNLKGYITNISENDANKLGYSSNEMIGCSGYDMIYQNDLFYVSQLHLQSIINKIPNTINLRRITKTNDVIPVFSAGTINETQNEIFVYEKFIRFNDQNAINFILNQDFSYCWINDKFTEVYGYTMNDLKSLKEMELVRTEHLTEFSTGVIELNKNNSASITFDRLCKNGKYIKVKVKALNKGNFYMISEILI